MLRTALAVILVLVSTPVFAGDLSRSGPIEVIPNDSGAGIYTGGTPGVSVFSGEILWPDVCGATCTIEPFPPDATNYVFSDGVAYIDGLGIRTEGVEANVEIIDEALIDQDGVDIAALFGITLTVGQDYDAWVVGSESAGEFAP